MFCLVAVSPYPKSRMEKHPDEVKLNWRFKVLKTIPSAMYRQILIRREEMKMDVEILNNKNEYSRCVLPQMEITLGGRKIAEKIPKEVQEVAKKKEREE